MEATCYSDWDEAENSNKRIRTLIFLYEGKQAALSDFIVMACLHRLLISSTALQKRPN